MQIKKLVMRGVLVTGLMAISGLFAIQAYDHNPPSSEQVAFAQQTSGLMLNELVAALFKEFDETTPANVENGKQAISLIFNNANKDMRLIGAFNPLLGGNNDEPKDDFEERALRRALRGLETTAVDRIEDRWYYRRSVPLTNTMHQNCVLCHANFTPQFFTRINNPGQWVGALTLRVPIDTN